MIDYDLWCNSEETRRSAQSVLSEWGAWSRGGWPNIGYSTHIPGTTPPEEQREKRLLRSAIDVDRAKDSEFIISTMLSSTKQKHPAIILRIRYAYGMTGERLIKRFRKETGRDESRACIEGELDLAEWVFASLLEGY